MSLLSFHFCTRADAVTIHDGETVFQQLKAITEGIVEAFEQDANVEFPAFINISGTHGLYLCPILLSPDRRM